MSERVAESLKRAFVAESRTYQRYSYLAAKLEEQASLAPTEEIVEILREAALRLRDTASEETRHAQMWLSTLETMTDPLQELQASRESEEADVEEYQQAARSAREEGKDPQAALFEMVALAEKRHAMMFASLSERLQRAWLAARLG
jgi:rubrerythrin